jgi:Domain of unknown function (DUF5071)
MESKFEKIIDCLSWNEDPVGQNEAIALLVAAGERLDLSLVLQKGDKSCWQNEARVIQELGYPRFREVVPAMLEWLQDLNWPGANEIVEALAGMPKDDLVGYISQAAEYAMEKGDDEWLFGLQHLVRESSLAAELVVDSRIRAILFNREAEG